jgi:hypothetical protein
MKASTERKLIRWMHIVFSIPIVGYIYGPVATLPVGSMLVKWIMFPIIVLSGLWLWKGQVIKKRFKNKRQLKTQQHIIQ